MDNKTKFLLRSDDGSLYRLDLAQIAAAKLPASDPAQPTTPTFAEAQAETKQGGKLQLECVIAFVEK